MSSGSDNLLKALEISVGGSLSLPVVSDRPVFSSGPEGVVHLHTSDDRVVVELLWHKVIKFIADVTLKQIRKSIHQLFFVLVREFFFSSAARCHQSPSPQTNIHHL